MKLTLAQVRDVLGCEVLVDSGALDTTEVEMAGAADMMSDVLAFAAPGGILLTGLRNVQSVITSHVAEVRAIVYVRGKLPDEEAVKLAEQKRIPLLTSKLSMFEACGRLFQKGLRSGSNIENR